MPPRLESWDAKTAPSQLALGRYLDHVAELTRERLAELGAGALSLELAVALPEGTDLLRGGYDLDNFLYPVVRRLGSHHFASAWISKERGTVSTVRIGPAVLADPQELGAWSSARAETTASTSTVAWKRQIAEQIAPADRLAPDGPLEVQLAFAAAARRNWAWLWKPAIDALGAIVGVEDARRPFSTRDDRIVRLALHRTIDDALGNRVRVGVWWRSA
ncbi:MAG TPA: hypothetical protein DCP25_03205 [Chloroflexi bacterium]|nr:hypothetical protein [Chloroflexota bacterium]